MGLLRQADREPNSVSLRRKKLKVSKLIGSIAIAAAAAAAEADIAYNNFAANYGFDHYSYELIGGIYDQGIGNQFASATTGIVSAVTLAIGGVGYYNIALCADDNGLPGKSLETWNDAFAAVDGVNAFAGDGSAFLTKGTLYWVTVEMTNSQDVGHWYDGVNGSNSAILLNGVWGKTEYGSAFRVDTTPVAEPDSALALVVGAAAIAANRRRAKKRRA